MGILPRKKKEGKRMEEEMLQMKAYARYQKGARTE
jgi:hypothetical protein